jgi:tetratricopeptide (TPR) repeat protein
VTTKPTELDTIPLDAIDDAEFESVEAQEEHGSIDRLMAATDQGWDVDDQVKTLQKAAASQPTTREKPKVDSKPPPGPRKGPPPLPGPGAGPVSGAGGAQASPSHPPPRPSWTPEPSAVRVQADMSDPGSLLDLLQGRATTLEGARDGVGGARIQIELSIASEAVLGDEHRAASHAEAAVKLNPASSAAHSLLRRTKQGRAALPSMLNHVDHEIAAATSEAHKVELLAVKARLLQALGNRGPDAIAVWEQALSLAPHHPAALKGLEAELVARAQAPGSTRREWEALSTHLVRMAEAYESEPALAAWLHVERAQVLERRLERVDTARDALERAVQLDPGIGPVRDALVRHAAAQGDWGALVRLLDEEAMIESNGGRAARLELEAAAICAWRLDDRRRACGLLERAAARAPTVPSVDRRALDELVRLNELDSRWVDAARARRARLRFVTEPAAITYELRALATAAENDGDLDAAIADVQRALAVDASDPTLVEALDRLLATAGKSEQRIATWLQEAARTEDPMLRARTLGRAAQICIEIGRPADAIRHLRSAWVAVPGDAEVLDGLARLLSPAPREASDGADGGARALVELYAQAAEQAHDDGRKTVYLEKMALLWEDVLGDPARAARAYEQVLAIDADRRSAVLGLQRAAARCGDARTLGRALLDEARLCSEGPAKLALLTRAATAFAGTDPARARQLVRDVLGRDPRHMLARALEMRLEEDVGRWELAARSLRARIDLLPPTQEKVALWIALAQLQHSRLRAPLDALSSLEQARAIDPSHPVPPEEIARVVEDHGDPRSLREAIERLAKHAPTVEERARHIAKAAELDELCLGDDASALRTYRRALDETPDDELVAARLARVAARRARQGHGAELLDLAALLAKRIERAAPAAAQAMTFDLAALLVEIGQDAARATALLESTLLERRDNVPAMRTLEAIRRRSGDPAPLARVLALEGTELKDARARLGALWNLAFLEEWKLSGGDAATTYTQILELDPTDPSALEALMRRDLPNARQGDPRARKTVFAALRALIAFASDDETRLSLQLRLALLLEAAATDRPDSHSGEELSREALDRYRDALRIDDLSPVAATGVARLASKLRDAEAAMAAAASLAELAVEPRARARYLVDAAEILLGPDPDPRLGPVPERRTRAASMLERALQAEPDSIAAAGRLATILLETHQGERLVSAFRQALAEAKSPDAMVLLGSEIARVARDELRDLPVAIDAMRRVRASAPQHVPSLLTLAELCIAQRVWPEAVDALEAVVSTGREVGPKLTAFFALASIYEKVLARPEEVDRALRAALALDPSNVRALRALLRRAALERMPDDVTAARARREEMADWLGRLADSEREPEPKTALLLELADVQVRLGNGKAAEKTLVEAVVTSPANTRAFSRLTALFRRVGGMDQAGFARALTSLVGYGDKLGRVDARWLAALGQLEIQALSRLREGVTHLQRAAVADPTLYETRFELAAGYAQLKANDEASRVLLGMIQPVAEPLLAISDPAAALALLEQTLNAEGKKEEAVVVTELRAIAGELEDVRATWLRARRPRALDAPTATLDRATLVTHVLPPEGRHVLLEVAAAIAGIEGKIIRADLASVGLTSRDKISPRSGHPTRALLDRIMRQLDVGDVELAIAPSAMRTRVLAQDEPWIVVSPAFAKQPEAVQVAGLARAAARIAFGAPWLEELSPAQIEAMLVAAARQVAKGYGAADAALLSQQEAAIARSMGRRQRKMLEELAAHLVGPSAKPPNAQDFVQALTRAELRAAFLVSGDLLAMLDEMRPLDAALHAAVGSPGTGALAALLGHPIAGDLVRFALTSESTALRRRLGSVWAR